MRRAAAALVFALACVPALAAAGWEDFFSPFLGDLRAEAADAQKAGKAGVLLMFHFDECPYCTRMKNEVLTRPEVQRHFRARFATVAIDTRGAQEVTGFDGRSQPEREYARALGVRATPTFRFFSLDGRQIAEHRGAIYDPAEFMLLADYVSSGAYRGETFAAYRKSRLKREG